MIKPRHEVCVRCGQAWNVSIKIPKRKPGEFYVCPRCARRGEGYFLRRK